MSEPRRVGVDIGGVIVERDPKKKVFEPLPDALDALMILRRRFNGELYLVSKCGPLMQQKIRYWMHDYDFFSHTGITPYNLFFCINRMDKAPIARQLKLTHFIDDRLEILAMLTSVEHQYLFRPNPTEIIHPTWKKHISKVTRVESWVEALTAIK